MSRLQVSFAAVAAAAVFAVAGCGGDDDDNGGGNGGGGGSSTGTTTQEESSGGGGGGGGAAQTLNIAADPDGALKFDKDTLTAKAGKVSIKMDNPSTLPHAVEIEGNGVEAEGETVNKGGVSTATADLKPGTYEFYCPVDGHEAGGMKGTLTVN
jgi:plastocyanin